VPFRGKIKRPDYIVGIPGVELVAFDVKAKTSPRGLIFDLNEIQKMGTFARLFHLTVYFACLNTEGGDKPGYWVRLDQLDEVQAVRAVKLSRSRFCRSRFTPRSFARLRSPSLLARHMRPSSRL
jgi:hypothetical protein